MIKILLGVLFCLIPLALFCISTSMREDVYAAEEEERRKNGYDDSNVLYASGHGYMINRMTNLQDILAIGHGIEKVFLNKGMMCAGCSVATKESLEAACLAHGLKVEDIIKELDAVLNSEWDDDKE